MAAFFEVVPEIAKNGGAEPRNHSPINRLGCQSLNDSVCDHVDVLKNWIQHFQKHLSYYVSDTESDINIHPNTKNEP
jgi:hypothetical protein